MIGTELLLIGRCEPELEDVYVLFKGMSLHLESLYTLTQGSFTLSMENEYWVL